MTMFASLRRSVALICATMLVSARDLRAAENNATDVVTAAKLFESYLDGTTDMKTGVNALLMENKP